MFAGIVVLWMSCVVDVCVVDVDVGVVDVMDVDVGVLPRRWEQVGTLAGLLISQSSVVTAFGPSEVPSMPSLVY
jgi:hypothetical protein